MAVWSPSSRMARIVILNVSFIGLGDLPPHLFPFYLPELSPCLWGIVMGRTIPSWRIIVEQEIAAMSRFKQFLGPEDRLVFDDLLIQCKLYAPQAGVLASPVKEVPLLLSMIFAHHRKLTELERRLNEMPK